VLTLMDALVRELGGDHRDGHRQGRRPGHRMVHLEKACWWTRHRRGDMFLLKLLLRNAFRHRLRTGLTILGLVVAITAFGLLPPSSTPGTRRGGQLRPPGHPQRHLADLRPAAELRPAHQGGRWRHRGQLGQLVRRHLPGEKNFFPSSRWSPPATCSSTPVRAQARGEGGLHPRPPGRGGGPQAGRPVRLEDRRPDPLRGTIYPAPGPSLRGIWTGAEAKTDENQMLVHYELVNESIKQRFPGRGDSTGAFIVGIDQPAMPRSSRSTSTPSSNSLAETLSETEAAFQLSFVSMSDAILAAIQAVSFIIIVIIMAVMANTMTMTARERLSEYATLKAWASAALRRRPALRRKPADRGDRRRAGPLATFPAVAGIAHALGSFLPAFHITPLTMGLQIGAALLVGTVAAAWPAWRMSHIDIVSGLRFMA
jgi:putative ABC transport system permease protein